MSLPLRRGDTAAAAAATTATRQLPPALQTSGLVAPRKPVIAQPVVPPPAPISRLSEQIAKAAEAAGVVGTVTSARAPASAAPSKIPQPLIPDVSLYSNPQFVPENDSTSLEELAHVVRLSKYQERKCANTRIRLQRTLISTAMSARLTRCSEIAYRNLADCFRGDDKKTFAGLFNAIHDVSKSCDELRKYALLEPEMEPLQIPGIGSSESLDTATGSATAAAGASAIRSASPFLNELSAEARDSFMAFFIQIRNNPDYLATRLSSLTNSELASMTASYHHLEPMDTVLPFSNRTPARGTSAAGRASGHVSGAIGRLLSFHRHDPLSALIHTCFANSAGPDSAEDRRRTEIWSTVCARLITDNRPEVVIISILSSWTSMRDWSGRSNMEWYLMKILEDGAFLLDRAEDQLGTRFNLSDWTSNDQIAANEFYDRAVHGLFEVIDDEDDTGIPEGLLELGNKVLGKLDAKRAETTRNWLVYKWLFGVWLRGVVIHPETYGLMAEYHVTEYGRQKILREVIRRALDMTMFLSTKSSKPVTVPPKIKVHIQNILNRFGPTKSQKPRAKLLPARSITSLRETVEAHPYLVVSPADLVTLVNSLFPERRPQSGHSGSILSGAASVSGFSAFSQPISMPIPRGGNAETPSEISTSMSSSATSDVTTSREPLLEAQSTGTSSRYSPPIGDPSMQKRLSNYEDDGYRLRLAIHDMRQALGLEAVHGSCHPCAERWAVLFISPDGSSLSSHMTYDPDDDADDEENSSTSDTDEEAEDDRPELDKDYHQLRDSILKLVEDYEIPQSAEADGSRAPQTFSNRATSLKKYRTKNNKIITAAKTTNRNPYRRRKSDRESDSGGSEPLSGSRGHDGGDERDAKGSEASSDDPAEPHSVLIAMLTAASTQSRAQSDFVSAHLYWRTLQQLNTLTSDSLRRNGFATLLNIFSRGPRDSIRRSAAAIEEYDAWLVWLKQSQERAEARIDNMSKKLRALRDKMWYVTDVRHSRAYEETHRIAVALKTMGTSRKWDSYQRMRTRGGATSFLYQAESDSVALMSVPESYGGPNKLSDDQAEKTALWLKQYGIENFCPGEERIHRFCCEVNNCIGELLGESSSVDTGAVLWSSELYKRDQKNFEGGRGPRDRDGSQFWDDSASVASDLDRRFSPGRPSSSIRDLRAMSARNISQQSFDSGRFSFSRASNPALSEVGDGQDYFSPSSPVPTIDTTTTYWSPFQAALTSSTTTSRAHSPTTSVTNLSNSFSHPNHHQLPSHFHHSTGRPGTSASSNETVYQQRLSEEKTRFFGDLRRTLTSLLLSDLGNLVFALGSETDSWFGKLGQDCIDRREALERVQRQIVVKEKRKSNRNSLKPRIIEKKKSFGDLRNAPGEAAPQAPPPGSEAAQPADAQPQLHPQPPDTPSSLGNDSSTATSDTMTAKNQQSPRKDATPEFPFTKAYQRLLRMFCVHPNPYAKLNALFELEHLIAASFSSGGSRRKLARLTRLDIGVSPPENAASPAVRSKPLEDAIDNVKERRSQAMIIQPAAAAAAASSFGSPISPNRAGSIAETRSIMSVNPAATDATTLVLQSLFRDPSIRPKSLFRDLQFIAAFVSSSVLDRTERGKAFWDTGLAALSLKHEVCQTMVELADEIVRVHTERPKRAAAAATASSTSSASTASGAAASAASAPHDATPQPPPGMPVPASALPLADAARMWTITAKEGDPTSQRELALFYLSNPELVDRTTLPLSKPREVFKQALMEKYSAGSTGGSRYASSYNSHHHHHHHGHHGGGSGAAVSGPGSAGGRPGTSGAEGPGGPGGGGAAVGPGGGGDVRSDPALMCVAIHWMEAAGRGGDELAKTFLGQNEIMGLG